MGSLQYLTLTRPDITFAVNRVFQSLQDPRQSKSSQTHIEIYQGHGLIFYKGGSLNLYGFSDANWVGCPYTRRRKSSSCICLGANCISWSSNKQTTGARSSLEVEYRTTTSTITDLIWIMFLLRDIGIKILKPPQLMCDNVSAIHIAKSPVFLSRTKHIEVDYYFVREKVVTKFVPTMKQVVDIFTRALSKDEFQRLEEQTRTV